MFHVLCAPVIKNVFAAQMLMGSSPDSLAGFEGMICSKGKGNGKEGKRKTSPK